ncbi:MAG: peptide deformylase [Gemmatimonadota bacterium]|nr:peptide deformylase [Gemmatimonadota bacterium]MDH3426948.1 peptide deformylase [Gemmatimonadota bacterium]
MANRQIRLLGDPILRERCPAVEQIDDEIRRLIQDLKDTMYEADGIGLAAPQIGVRRRVFVYDVREDEHAAGVLINPRITESEGTVRESEGCLSIPDLTEVVERAARVVVEGLDEEGRALRLEADGLLSRCVQHESDHLDGILFFDRVSPLKRKMLLAKWAKSEHGANSA